MKRWTLIACCLAIVLFVLAVRADVYELTSPSLWAWHIALRKAYSIVAFSFLGYATRRALDEHGVLRSPAITIAAIAAYSALIEVAQWLAGSHEGLGWNAIDVACGAVGGALGDCVARVNVRNRPLG